MYSTDKGSVRPWTGDIRPKKGSEAVSLALGFGRQHQEGWDSLKLRWEASEPVDSEEKDSKL